MRAHRRRRSVPGAPSSFARLSDGRVSCATAATGRPDSVSRFNRLSSARRSDGVRGGAPFVNAQGSIGAVIRSGAKHLRFGDRRPRQLGQTKIQNLRLAARGHENIRGFDVSMYNPPGVSAVQSIRNLNCQVQQFVQLKRLALDAVLQRLPFQQLHGDEGLTLVLPYVVNGTNVRMVQRGCGAGLALEAIDRIFVREQYLRQELERNGPVEPRVHRFVDYSHAPAAQQRFDLVMTYLPPGERVLLLYGNNSGCRLQSPRYQSVTSL